MAGELTASWFPSQGLARQAHTTYATATFTAPTATATATFTPTVYSDVYAYAYGHSNVHAYSNSDCYSGNPDSDANMHAGRDLVRHFERFWYSGG